MGTNFVIVGGKIGHPPEVRGKGDKKTVNFVVPVDEYWIDKETGQENKRTEWMRCVVFDRNAQIADGRLMQGTSVLCKGSNRTEKFKDAKGIEQTRTKIVCGEITIMDSETSSPIVIDNSKDLKSIQKLNEASVPPSALATLLNYVRRLVRNS